MEMEMSSAGEQQGGQRWLEDATPACSDLVRRLIAGAAVESRDFLRPVFKWMKAPTSKYFDPEKAFTFLVVQQSFELNYVEWMEALRDHGDDTLGISPLPQLQPKYGYNTLVTMSQRNDCKETALRAYECMIARNYDIDVFTYTSLLDVTGRNGHFDESLLIYEKMCKGKNKPNVVTFITLIRVLSGWHRKSNAPADDTRAKETIIRLLNEADDLLQNAQSDRVLEGDSSQRTAPVYVGGSDGKVDISVYNAALAGFVKLADIDFFVKVLQMMYSKSIALNNISLDIICKFYHLHVSKRYDEKLSDINAYGRYLVDVSCISSLTSNLLESNLNAYLERKQLQQLRQQQGAGVVSSRPDNVRLSSMRQGCLGRDAPAAMRESVIAHDMDKLLERISPDDSSQLSESDFITLLHQCRKRKWGDQIAAVFEGMRRISTEGIPSKGIPPQTSLTPSLLAYEAALSGYFCVSALEDAWKLFQEAISDPQVWMTASFEMDLEEDDDTFSISALHFFRFVLKGFLSCGASSRAYDAFCSMEDMNGVSPSFPVVKCLLRGFGTEPHLGIYVLERLLPSTDASFLHSYALTSIEGYSNPKFSDNIGSDILIHEGNLELLCTLFESVAVLGHADKISSVIKGCLSSSCEMLRQLMSELLQQNSGNFSEKAIVHFNVVLLMAASSTNSVCDASKIIYNWQQNKYLSATTFMYSLILEALAGSVGGTSQRAVCDGMLSLPFRGFLRVGAVKKLHSFVGNQTFCDLMLRSREFHMDVFDETQCTTSGGSFFGDDIVRFFDAFQDNIPVDKDSDEVDGVPDRLSNEDFVLNFYLRRCLNNLLAGDEHSSSVSLLLYLQHIYARLLIVRSKPMQLRFHENIRTSFETLISTSSDGILLFKNIFSKCGNLLQRLEVPDNFQAKVVSGLLKSFHQNSFLLTALKVLVKQWSQSIDDMTASNLPCLDLSKEIFKHLLSSRMSISQDDLQILRLEIVSVLENYMRFRLSSPLKIIQVFQHHKLFADTDLERFEEIFTNTLLLHERNIQSEAKKTQELLVPLSAYVKSSEKTYHRDACIRICRRLVSSSRGDVAAALLCRFQVLDCEEFRPQLFPSESIFNGELSSTRMLSDKCNESEINMETGIDFASHLNEVDGLPVLKVTNDMLTCIHLVQDLNSLQEAEEFFAKFLCAAEAAANSTERYSSLDSTRLEVNDTKKSVHYFIAIDCEWKPQRTVLVENIPVKSMNKVCLLQIATSSSDVFLFDLMKLERSWLNNLENSGSTEQDMLWSRYADLMQRLLSCEYLLKLGFHIDGDIIRLQESFPLASHYRDWQAMHDLSVTLKRKESGLASMCKDVLGLGMDKRMQCSNWERRPLHERQVEYAALDSLVLVRIWQKMQGIALMDM